VGTSRETPGIVGQPQNFTRRKRKGKYRERKVGAVRGENSGEGGRSIGGGLHDEVQIETYMDQNKRLRRKLAMVRVGNFGASWPWRQFGRSERGELVSRGRSGKNDLAENKDCILRIKLVPEQGL